MEPPKEESFEKYPEKGPRHRCVTSEEEVWLSHVFWHMWGIGLMVTRLACPRALSLLTPTQRLYRKPKCKGVEMPIIPYLILVIKEGVNTGPCSNIPNLYTFVR